MLYPNYIPDGVKTVVTMIIVSINVAYFCYILYTIRISLESYEKEGAGILGEFIERIEGAVQGAVQGAGAGVGAGAGAGAGGGGGGGDPAGAQRMHRRNGAAATHATTSTISASSFSSFASFASSAGIGFASFATGGSLVVRGEEAAGERACCCPVP